MGQSRFLEQQIDWLTSNSLKTVAVHFDISASGGFVIHIDQQTDTTQDGNTVIVLTPAGRLDITTAWQFRLKLQECISKLSRHVVVNLGQVNFIDSSGLTSLVAGMRDADKVKSPSAVIE